MSTSSGWQSLVCLLLGAICLAFGQGHWPHGTMLLCGLVLWIRFVRISRPRVAIPAVVAGNLLVWEWAYAGMVPMPTGIRWGMFAGIAFVFALLLQIDRWVNRRWKSLWATLPLACGWVTFDLLSARVSPGGTWASIAYTYVDDMMISQVASLVGWTGITFVIIWLASTINWIWDRREAGSAGGLRGLVAVVTTLMAIVLFALTRVASIPMGIPVRIACVVAPNTFNDESLEDVFAYTRGIQVPEASTVRARARIQQSMHEHFGVVENAIATDPDFVIWPEANAVMTVAEEASWLDKARELARQHEVFIGMGLVVFHPATPDRTLNKFVLVDSQGELAMEYLKATRVPGSSHQKGDGVLPVVESEFGRLSAAICFDMDFPQVIAQAGRAEVDLFFAPSNDWLEARATHARMARMRGIEQGFVLIRPTKDGTTLIADGMGRTLTSMTLDDNRTGSITMEIPVRSRNTLYAHIGDLFAYLCGIGGLVLMMVARKHSPRDEGGSASRGVRNRHHKVARQ